MGCARASRNGRQVQDLRYARETHCLSGEAAGFARSRSRPSRIAKQRLPRHCRRDGEVHPGPVRGGTKRLGFACGDAHIARDTGHQCLSGAQVITVGAWRPV